MPDFDIDSAIQAASQQPDSSALPSFDIESALAAAQPAPVTKPAPIDPSAGGGELSIGPFDTGIQTPQWADRYLSGIGQTLSTSASGISQGIDELGNKLGLVPDSKVTQDSANVATTRKLDAPLLKTTAGNLGAISGKMAEGALVPGGFLSQIAGQAGLAALDPTTGGEGRIGNATTAALGSAITGGAFAIPKLLVQPFSGALSKSAQALVNAGIPLDTAQATGGKLASSLKRYVSDNPFIGGSEFPAQKQAPAATQAVLSELGSSSDTADAATMNAIKDKATGTMNTVYGRNPINLDDKHVITNTGNLFGAKTVPTNYGTAETPLSFNDGLQTIWNRASDEFSGPNEADGVKNVITNLRRQARANNGDIPTNVAQSVRQEVSGLSQAADPRIRELGGHLGELMDQAMASQEAVPGDALNLFKANQDFAALQPVKDSLVRTSRTGAENQVGLPQLNSVLTSARNADSVAFGTNNPVKDSLMSLAKAGANVLPDKLGNSGTAARYLTPALLGAAAGTAGGFFGGDSGTFDPIEAAKFAALGIAAPLAARYAIYNKLPRATANMPWLSNLFSGLTRFGTAAGAVNSKK